MKAYWIIYSLCLIVSIINESRLIYRLKQYHGKLKFTSLTLIYSILAFNLGVSVALNGWEILLRLVFLSFALWWNIKDFSLGLIVHRDILALGTGRWDKMWKLWPKYLLLAFRFIVILISIGLYLHPNLIAFAIFGFIFLILILVLFIKTKQ